MTEPADITAPEPTPIPDTSVRPTAEAVAAATPALLTAPEGYVQPRPELADGIEKTSAEQRPEQPTGDPNLVQVGRKAEATLEPGAARADRPIA